ncbi:hypothetical protein [Peredibacter starrii]|uniref:Uncharacterized protein n=1 Tax=Peredibacter starrii TaxID=28202 RepID=A0AAX4HLC4_9BACT|nr:hypothetical protein [Peredibacter starrii]WPU64054.1 hypothetical protein SOO65_15260 [Peredibacter starrii]
MNKLFWSAFAMSLILLAPGAWSQGQTDEEFLGLESEILPELKGEQRFTSPELHQKEDWKVEPKKVEADVSEPAKGQGYSIIPWSTQDPEEWMDITKWVIEREVKDVTPDWKLRVRQAEHKELVGKILQCKGSCSVFRGSNSAKVQHLSRLLEGDELNTDKDSVAWVYLMDGTLVRLGPETSVSIQEINFGKSEIFVLTRLNRGHIFWHPRSKGEVATNFAPETDSLSLPLLVREANVEFYEREIFKSQTDSQHLAEVMELDDNAIKGQMKALNDLKTQNGEMPLETRFMVVAPNSTLVGKNVSFDFTYQSGGKAYFKKRGTNLGEEFTVHLRGYSMTQAIPVSEEDWHEVEVNGRSYTSLENVPGMLQILELLTKRIKTLELAREMWIRDFTLPVMKVVNEPEKLAVEHGYTRWGEELDKRLQFLVEYTRRIETTNLRSLENLLGKLESNGEKVERNLNENQYRVSLNHYLLGLKSRYDHKKMRVREMNDLHYYVWILRNGKF